MRTIRSKKQLPDLFRIKPGTKVRLKSMPTAWPTDSKSSKKELKKKALEFLSEDVAALAEAQQRLYASDTWSVLLIFQAMDAAGKDGTIKHVMSGVNPQGCQVFSFKHPSAEELDHNFLWRYSKALPERGRIGIFNRSYYEEVLIVRVHSELVKAQKIPGTHTGNQLWKDRFHDINAFEKHLAQNGTLILKFFLHLSKDEQKARFLDRLNDPSKNWKFSASDIKERQYWDDYMEAYEEAISATSTAWAPWHVVPADRKWASRTIVATTITQAMDKLNLRYPEISKEQRKQLKHARALLENEK